MCEKAKKIIQEFGEGVYIKTEDGYCPTLLYYHIRSCDKCIINSSNVDQLGSR